MSEKKKMAKTPAAPPKAPRVMPLPFKSVKVFPNAYEIMDPAAHSHSPYSIDRRHHPIRGGTYSLVTLPKVHPWRLGWILYLHIDQPPLPSLIV
jgi:hypothetical protein